LTLKKILFPLDRCQEGEKGGEAFKGRSLDQRGTEQRGTGTEKLVPRGRSGKKEMKKKNRRESKLKKGGVWGGKHPIGGGACTEKKKEPKDPWA